MGERSKIDMNKFLKKQSRDKFGDMPAEKTHKDKKKYKRRKKHQRKWEDIIDEEDD